MPGEFVPIDDGSSGPFYTLDLSSWGQDVNWNFAQEQPIPASFTLSQSYALVSNRKIEFMIVFSEPVASWLTLSGASVVGNEISTTGSVMKNLSLNLSNTAELPNGSYHAEIIFSAYGRYSGSGSLMLLSMVSYFFTLNITNNDSASIKAEFNQYNLFFNRQSNVLSGDTQVNILNNSTPLFLKFKADHFVEKTDVTSNFSLQGINIENDPMLPNEGSIQIIGGLFKADQSRISNVNINLSIGLNADIFSDKQSLQFSMIKSNTQAATSNFYLTNPEEKAFTITAPAWLNLSITSGSESTYVTCTTDPPSEMSGGIYNGEIVVSYDNKNFSIPVVLTVISFLNFNFETNNNFCLDVPVVKFNRMNPGARFVRIVLSSKFNLMGEEYLKEDTYTIPYVNEKCEFSIGQKIQKKFPKYKKDFFNLTTETELMRAAEVSFKADELDISYSSLLSETLSGLNLFPGSKPTMFPLVSDLQWRKKNKGSIFFNSRVDNNRILVEKITNVENIQTLVYGSNTIAYYTYPDYKKILNFHFETNNFCPEWFSFTGEFKISADYSHIYAKGVFKSQNEKYDFTKIKTLTLNTGYFIKQELKIIEKIIESKLCYVNIEGKIYRCFSTTQKFVLEDSQDELSNKELEFLIIE